GAADVQGGAAAGHRVDDEAVRGREIINRVRDDRGRNRAGVGDAEGVVVTERPDVVGGGAEPGGVAVAAPEVLVGGVDCLGPGVELGDGGPGAGVVLLGGSPDRAGLPVSVLAPQTDSAG